MTAQREPEKRPWWHVRRIGAWVGGALLGGLATTIHQWTKPDVLEAAGKWALAPSGLPNGLAVLAALVVLVPLFLGCVALVRRAKSKPPAFTRGVFASGYWRWEFDAGSPAWIEPVCPFDETPLTVGAGDYRDEPPEPVDLDSWDCSRCRFHAVAETGWEARIRNQIRGEIDSGAWVEHRAELSRRLGELKDRVADNKHCWDLDTLAPTHRP